MDLNCRFDNRWILYLWVALSPSSLIIWFDKEIGSLEIGVISLILYTAGTIALVSSCRRDPPGQKLRIFAKSRVGKVAILAVVCFIGVLSAAISIGTGLLALLAAAALFLGLLAVKKTGEELQSVVVNVLLATVSFSLVCIIGEIVFRLPVVVRWTGGNTPGMNRWAKANYDRVWEKNPSRLRSFHVEELKPPQIIRILTVGDSFTWGYFVAQTQDIWPYVMEKNLQKNGYDIQVINIGMNALSTVDEKRRLDEIGWTFDPDLVILQYTLNDPVPNNYSSQFRLYALIPGLNNFLDQNSYFFSFLNARFRGLQMRLFYPRGEGALFDDGFSGWQASRQAIQDMAANARGRGVSFAGVVFPLFVFGGLDDHAYPFLEAHRKVMGAFKSTGVPVLDLRPAYAETGKNGLSWWALPCQPHPNKDAHELAGRVVAEWLISQRILEKSAEYATRLRRETGDTLRTNVLGKGP